MRIVVLNGSPKGEISVTMQSVNYLQKKYPQHDFHILHISQRIKRIEKDEAVFRDILDDIRAADGVLWAFPLYYMLVHAHYKRFIELIFERGAQDAFAGKYTAAFSTSIHFFDHTAHRYVHAICDDLGMKFVGSFSADMYDLLHRQGRAQLDLFAADFFEAIEKRRPTARSYPPLAARDFDYAPGQGLHDLDTGGNKIVVLTDHRSPQANLARMVDRFQASFVAPVDVINLYDIDIKASCQGCLHCGYDNECAFEGKDGFVEFFETAVKAADILIFAGTIVDRYLSSRWKTFFDRSFYNGHAPVLRGKQLGFIVSGPLGQNFNLREILEGYADCEQANAVGFVTDETGASADIDAGLQDLAARCVQYARSAYMPPRTFLAVGGTKVFRDDIWGRLRTAFRADHLAYKRLGAYDFPQRKIRLRLVNALYMTLLGVPRIRQEVFKRFKAGMIQPHRKVLESL